jgi:hypothetical protein
LVDVTVARLARIAVADACLATTVARLARLATVAHLDLHRSDAVANRSCGRLDSGLGYVSTVVDGTGWADE